ncbi:MAG: YigZ family protein [Anaerocolumna aminovalerica]|uniref:YigZ family protein n=2 Tax=Anaerocolumna aminovalerica TaxID=1527 RepID=UPI00290C6CC8|nr:YigZ family protein [Anaerocolumna aminovalerica]MDU6263518.1 YigZ family protein [Anaerocolumna aminovalerica]
MIDSFRIVYQGGTGEIIEKKSRFIATVVPVNTEEEAITFIEQTKKKYYDANHNCFAYVIGDNNEIQRCSDDGEPVRTAGRPMLDVLLGEGIHNAALVVTRYFGGTLLGTGGLVRAYQGAAKEGLNNSIILEKLNGIKLQITTDYNGIGKLQYITSQMEITTLDTEYTDIVVMTNLVPIELYEQFEKKVVEATNGKAVIINSGNVSYAIMNHSVLIL